MPTVVQQSREMSKGDDSVQKDKKDEESKLGMRTLDADLESRINI